MPCGLSCGMRRGPAERWRLPALSAEMFNDDDPEGLILRRRQLLAEALADKLRSAKLEDTDRAILEDELEQALDAVWEARNRLFDRDATGQDEEAFYERFGLSGESHPRNDAGEYIGLM